ncbi:MAG: 4Fe-4S dicluster domain-containing protein [Ruminococcaceae bacterium]|nr:4Fe-4S dicluster domain-containing protein [Oscillospiraceae bacterium]MBR2879939.1 4Fe-4S binding protein [Oscillospiraceae bacterium]
MYVINDSCIACGACSDSCPAEAIAMNDDLGRYAIDENKCMDCGACADTCPMGCIAAE